MQAASVSLNISLVPKLCFLRLQLAVDQFQPRWFSLSVGFKEPIRANDGARSPTMLLPAAAAAAAAATA
jgi:hypothetical protein